jgi:hypothetical protein
MHGLVAFLIASNTLAGCVAIPLNFLGVVPGPDVRSFTIRELLASSEARQALHEQIAPRITALVAFAGVGTIAGTAAGDVWWLVREFSARAALHASPVTYAAIGGGLGVIASMNLSVPVLGAGRLLRAMYPSRFLKAKQGPSPWQWPEIAFT